MNTTIFLPADPEAKEIKETIFLDPLIQDQPDNGMEGQIKRTGTVSKRYSVTLDLRKITQYRETLRSRPIRRSAAGQCWRETVWDLLSGTSFSFSTCVRDLADLPLRAETAIRGVLEFTLAEAHCVA